MSLEDSHETQEFFLQLHTLLPGTDLFSFSVLSLRRTVKISGALLLRSRFRVSLEGVSILLTQLVPAEEALCSTPVLLRRQSAVFEMYILPTSRNTPILQE